MIGVQGRDRMRLSPTFARSERGRHIRDIYDLAAIKQTNDPDSEYWRARKKYFSVFNTDAEVEVEDAIEWAVLGPILAYVSLFCIMKVRQCAMSFNRYIDSSLIQCVRSLCANYPRLHRLATPTCCSIVVKVYHKFNHHEATKNREEAHFATVSNRENGSKATDTQVDTTHSHAHYFSQDWVTREEEIAKAFADAHSSR
jgi:hypothetical protein